MVINILFYFFVLVLGLCIGSFLNCVIYRLEKEESFVKGRSYCPHCKHGLAWYDLFPVFSFLSLGGKCRYCKKKISWQYPIVEIATALIFLLILAFSHYALLNIVFLFYVFSVLIIIFVYDLKHYLIPDKVLFPAIIIAFLFRILNLFRISDFGFRIFTGYIAAIIIAAGFFLFIFLISRGKWMGFGDVKLAVLLGLVLGFPNILVGLFLAFLFGAIIGVIIMALKKKGLKSEIPFGPFLIAGTFVALLWGQQIINWYLSLIF